MQPDSEQHPLLPEPSLLGKASSSGRLLGLLACAAGIVAFGATASLLERKPEFRSRGLGGLPKFDAWYVNVEEATARDSCMRKKLEHAGIVPHRFTALRFENCTDKETFAQCLELQGFGDCVQGGIDWEGVAVHGTDHGVSFSSSLETSSHIISNWCSHKRLFSQLAEATDASGYALVMEDDVVIDIAKLKPVIESFLHGYHAEWDLVVVDPIYSQKLGEAGSQCDSNEVGQHRGDAVWKVPPVVSDDISEKRCKFASCDFCGAQALLVRKSALKDVVSAMEGMRTVPLDWLPRHLPKALAWRPRVAMNSRGLTPSLPEFCSGEVLGSTIGGAEGPPDAQAGDAASPS